MAKSERVIELKDGDVIRFVAVTPDYGVAEFQFCPVYKRGKLLEVYVYPKQQHFAGPAPVWRVKVGWKAEFQVMSWTFKGIEQPNPWMYFWCEEHKCTGMNVYVPRNANALQLAHMGSTATFAFNDTEAPHGKV